jgi:predicted enzyme related to lactoylglutathione lyase
MAKFRVIEGTVWEIEADTIEQAKAFYEGYFNGQETDALPMNEVRGDSYWYGEGESEE